MSVRLARRADEELSGDDLVQKVSVRDVERVERVLGEFPIDAISAAIGRAGIRLDVGEIPRRFAKYFAVMTALANDQLEGKLLVDFGCGLGVFVSQASALGMTAEGIDVFVEYGGRCLEAAKLISDLVAASAPPMLTELDFLAEDVIRDADFVTSFGMLEHIHGEANQEAVIGKMMRALKPGGHLILTCGPNKRFPIDFHHYGPSFLFYHCLPVSVRGAYLRMFARTGQNRNPRWLNGMSVAHIERAIRKHGGVSVEAGFPLWVSMSQDRRMQLPGLRQLASIVSISLAKLKAEPVIIMVARKAP